MRPAREPSGVGGGVEQDGLGGALDVGEERPRDAGVAGRVVSLNYVGAATRVGVDAEGLLLHVTVPAGSAVPEQGDQVMLTFNREHIHLMGAEA